MAKIHIGKKIKAVLKYSGIGATEFAKRINRTRNVVYHIMSRENINTELLLTISRALDHDFFAYYSQQVRKK